MAYDDDEGWDDEGIALLESDGWDTEARRSRMPRYVRQAAGRRPPMPAPPRPPTAGVRGAVMNTPAGQARVNFEKPVASKEDLDNLSRQVEAIRASMRRVDEQLDKNTAILDKKVAAIETAGRRQGQQGQMATLLPLLLSSPPEVETITFATTPAANTPLAAAVKYKPSDNMPLLMAMMLGGGLGGGGSDDNSMMPLMMIAMMGGFGKRS